MPKSKTFHYSTGAIVGAIVALFSLKLMSCGNSTSTNLDAQRGLLSCPASPLAVPLKRASGKTRLVLVVPSGIVVHVGESYPVTLELDATATPVNAIDVVLVYPTSSVHLIAKDESISPFAIRFGKLPVDALNETMQAQPNPGIESFVTLAKFTFQALQAGTTTITAASSSQVLANDGFGTNVLGSVQDAVITVQ